MRADIAKYEELLKALYKAEKLLMGVGSSPQKQYENNMAVIRDVVPPEGMKIEDLRLAIHRAPVKEKGEKKGAVDLSLRTNETRGNIVIRDYTVYLPEHDPKPGEPSQKLPPEWYSALEPKI